MKSVTHSIPEGHVRRSGAGRRLLSAYRTEIAIALAIIVIELAVGMIVPAALSGGNISNVTQAAAPLVIMAFGVLLVIITGGIDLSVGSVFSLTGMVTGLVMAHGYGAIASSFAGLSVGILIGAINGALVTFVGLAPFVVTLSTYAIAGSLSFIVTDGHSLPISNPDYWLLNSGTLIPG
ncbi:MAG: ABC transporter permease, partial [Paraburkholderia sp.]